VVIGPSLVREEILEGYNIAGTCDLRDLESRRLYFHKFGLEQGLFETCNCDNSSYHAMQIKVQKRESRAGFPSVIYLLQSHGQLGRWQIFF
jgi:hypothetical protein